MLFLVLSFGQTNLSMKKFTIIILLITGFVGNSQRAVFDDWFIAGGFNAVNSLGTLNPFESPGDWMFKNPFTVSAERQFARDFNFEFALNLNGINQGERFDPVPATSDFTYISFDTNVRYNFGRLIFRRGYDKIDFSAIGGAGFFRIDGSNLSFNLGGAALFWLNENNTFGLRLQVVGKFALNNDSSGFENNHYQYGLHAVWRL